MKRTILFESTHVPEIIHQCTEKGFETYKVSFNKGLLHHFKAFSHMTRKPINVGICRENKILPES